MCIRDSHFLFAGELKLFDAYGSVPGRNGKVSLAVGDDFARFTLEIHFLGLENLQLETLAFRGEQFSICRRIRAQASYQVVHLPAAVIPIDATQLLR